MMKTYAIASALFLRLAFTASGDEVTLEECAGIGGDFRISPYLKVAKLLQDRGEGASIKQLRSWAKSRKHDEQVIILCRMLFDVGAAINFRAPRLGAPMAFGGKDWPLVPITIHEDVPILITRGYLLAGVAESGSRYLEFCVSNLRWSETKFLPKSEEELERIVGQWLSETEWPSPLRDVDKQFFTRQAKGALPPE